MMRYAKGVPYSMSPMLFRFMALKWKRRAFFSFHFNFFFFLRCNTTFANYYSRANLLTETIEIAILSLYQRWALCTYEFGRKGKIVKRERNCINKSKRQHRNKSGTEKGKKNKKKKWLWPSGNWPSWYQRRIAGRWLHFKELNYCFHIFSSYAIDCVLLHELRSISQFSINLFHMKIMNFFVFRWIEFLAERSNRGTCKLVVWKWNEINHLARVTVTFVHKYFL